MAKRGRKPSAPYVTMWKEVVEGGRAAPLKARLSFHAARSIDAVVGMPLRLPTFRLRNRDHAFSVGRNRCEAARRSRPRGGNGGAPDPGSFRGATAGFGERSSPIGSAEYPPSSGRSCAMVW